MPLLLLPPPTVSANTFPVTSNIADADICVEWSPGVDAGATPLWADITSYVRGVETQRGRERLLELYETGTCTVSLDNRSRRFDPTYAAGPYYGKILPLARFRVRLQYGNKTYPVYDGYAEGWSQGYDLNGDSVCEVTLADAFKVFSLLGPSSPWVAEIISRSPEHWYRFSESGGTTMLDAYGRGPGTFVGNPTYSQASLVDSDTNTSIGFSGGSYGRVTFPNAPGILIGFEGWFASTASGTQQTIIQYGPPDIGYAMMSVDLNTIGQVNFRIWQFNDTTNPSLSLSTVYTTTSSSYGDGNPHHFSIFAGGNSPTSLRWFTCSLDGLRKDVDLSVTITNEPTTAMPTRSNELVIGNRNDDTARFSGRIDEIVVYLNDTVIAAGDEGAAEYSSVPSTVELQEFVKAVAGHYSFGKTPFNGDRTDVRFTRILDSINWPTSERLVSTGTSTVQSWNFLGGTVLDSLNEIQTAEQGQLFVNAEGRVRFKGRYSLTTGGYKATFGDGFTGEPIVFSGTSGQGVFAAHAADMATSTVNVAVQSTMSSWTAISSTQDFVGKWGLAGQRSWRFSVNTSENLIVEMSSNGTAITTITSTATLPSAGFVDGGTYWVRFLLTVSGAGYSCTFYTSSNGTTWNQLGTTVTAATPTSLFNASSTNLVVGNTVANDQRFVGSISRFLFNNSSSTASWVVVDADFTQSLNPDTWVVTKSGSLFTDAAGHDWSTQGSTYWQNVEVPYSQLKLAYDDSLIRNYATVSRNGGAEVTSINETSLAKYFARSYSFSGSILADDAQLKDFADSVTQRFGNPYVRTEGITVLPEGLSSHSYPRILPLDVGDFVRVIRRPQGVGTPLSVDCFVDRIRYQIGTGGPLNVVEYGLTEAITTQYWVLDDPIYSKLGFTTRLAY